MYQSSDHGAMPEMGREGIALEDGCSRLLENSGGRLIELHHLIRLEQSGRGLLENGSRRLIDVAQIRRVARDVVDEVIPRHERRSQNRVLRINSGVNDGYHDAQTRGIGLNNARSIRCIHRWLLDVACPGPRPVELN